MVDYGRDRGIAYLTMELLEGEDLGALIARRKLSFERIADIMLAVCSAVATAHQIGVIHRDLKPQNIFLARISTGETVPKVLDFGISKVRLPGDPKLTQRFSLLGTPNYVSPEQAEGGPVDARCDVYALGTILYECLTGRRCHEGTTLYAILRSIAEADYPRPSQLMPDVPPDFEAVILKALARKPDDRFATVLDLGRALFPFASLKRQSSWKDYYFPTGESTASGTFNFIPLSGSKHQPSLQPKTELLPEGDARPLAGPSFRKASGPPAAIAPSPDSSRRRREAVAPVARPEKSPSSSKSAAPAKTGAWLWPVLSGCLVGVVVLVVFLVLNRRPAVEISRPGTAGPQPTAGMVEPVSLPPLAGAATVPTPPVPSHEVVVPQAIPVASDPTATSTSKSSNFASPTGHHGASDSQRHVHTKVRDGRSEHQIKRNRSGIPLLEP
jgi:serine/threonine-protein kinase